MKILIELYELKDSEKSNFLEKNLYKLHKNEINRLGEKLKKEFDENFIYDTSNIILKLQKYRSGKHRIVTDLIKSKDLQKKANIFINSYFKY